MSVDPYERGLAFYLLRLFLTWFSLCLFDLLHRSGSDNVDLRHQFAPIEPSRDQKDPPDLHRHNTYACYTSTIVQIEQQYYSLSPTDHGL